MHSDSKPRTGLAAWAKSFLFGGAPALEGQWRGPFGGHGHLGNWFTLGRKEDGFQRALEMRAYGMNGIVMACTLVIARLLSASYPNHYRVTERGGRKLVATSAAHRLLMRPNPAQNAMDWISHIVISLCLQGNVYFYVKRNDRNEPVELIPLAHYCRPFIAPNNELYYNVSENNEWRYGDLSNVLPARDVLHIKLPSRNSILTGDSLISYAYSAIGLNNAIAEGQSTFLNNMARPSGVLTTEQPLSSQQMDALRTKFDEVSRGMAQGGVPILGFGLKFSPMGVNAQDSQLLESYNASVLDICRIFGVPIQLLGLETSGPASSVSTLIGQFRVGSMLYFSELIEMALEDLFKFDHINDTVRFDLDNVSRADFGSEVDTLSKAVQNALMSPNEGRNRLGNDSVDFGDEPRVQAQNVRLEDAKPQASAGKEEPAPVEAKPEPPPPEPQESKYMDDDYVKMKLAQLVSEYSRV